MAKISVILRCLAQRGLEGRAALLPRAGLDLNAACRYHDDDMMNMAADSEMTQTERIVLSRRDTEGCGKHPFRRDVK